MESGGVRGRELCIALLVAALACLLPFWHQSGLRCSADGSSYALSLALARDGSSSIEQTKFFTAGVDLAEVDGKPFSDRPPALGFVGVPFLWIGQQLADWSDAELLTEQFDAGTIEPFKGRLPFSDAGIRSVLFVPLLAHFLTVLALYFIARRMGCSSVAAATTALAYGIGTFSIKYAATYFTHGLAAACLTLLSWSLFELRKCERPLAARIVFAGFLLGCMPAVEYATLVLVPIILAAYFLGGGGWHFKSLRFWGLGALGCLLPVLSLATYNYRNFGSPFNVSYSFNRAFAWARLPGETFVTPSLEGLEGLLLNRLTEGLLSSSPFMFLALFGLILMRRRARPEALFITFVSGAFLILISKHRTWWGGGTTDPRYILAVLPLMCLPLGMAVDWIRKCPALLFRRVLVVSLAVLLTFSFFSNYFELRAFLFQRWLPTYTLRAGFLYWVSSIGSEGLLRLPLYGLLTAVALVPILLLLRGLQIQISGFRFYRTALAFAVLLAPISLAALHFWPQFVPAAKTGKDGLQYRPVLEISLDSSAETDAEPTK